MTSCWVVDVTKNKCRLKDLIMKHPSNFFFSSFLKDLKGCNHLNKHCYKRCFSCCKYVFKYVFVSTTDVDLSSGKHRLLGVVETVIIWRSAEARKQVQGVKFSSGDAKIESLFYFFLGILDGLSWFGCGHKQNSSFSCGAIRKKKPKLYSHCGRSLRICAGLCFQSSSFSNGVINTITAFLQGFCSTGSLIWLP